MPLIFLAYVVGAAGLLSGFGGAAFPAVAAAVCTLGAAALRRDGRLAGLATLGGAAAVLAAVTARADGRCAERAAASGILHARLLGVARPGGRAPARLEEDGCRARVSLAVARGGAGEGALVRVAGDVELRGAAVWVDHAVLVMASPPPPAARWRARSGRALDRLYREDAGLARALLIADTRGLDRALRERFADAGLVHLLSVSGLHVAIVAGAVELLLIALRVPRRRAGWAAVALTAAYVVGIGAPAPAVRSGVMLGAGVLGRLLQRPTSPWASLALGALVPLHDPRTVLDLGYQLSVVGIAGLIAAGALSRRWRHGRLRGWRAVVLRDLVASTLASLVTLPLIAWTFGRVSLVAPLTNLAAGPLVALLQPTLFLSLAFAPLGGAAAFVADVARLAMRALDALAAVAAALPWSAISIAPSLAHVLLLGAAAAALVVACCAERPGRALVALAGTLGVLAMLDLVPARTGVAELHVIDVEQGDAIALRTPRGRWVLFDAGRAWNGGDAGRRVVIPYLRRRGGALAAFVLSHPHGDHVGGAASVLRAMRPRTFLDGAYVAPSGDYRAALEAARARGIAWQRAHPGDSLVIDGVVVTILAPDSAWTTALDDPNEASTVAMVRYGRVRFLLTGDAERREEAWLLARYPDALQADVLKVAHHGSATSSTAPFLGAVRPRLALVSVGARNTYGHPNGGVIRRLRAHGAQVLRTDHLGSVIVRTDGRTIEVRADGERWLP